MHNRSIKRWKYHVPFPERTYLQIINLLPGTERMRDARIGLTIVFMYLSFYSSKSKFQDYYFS